MSNVLRIGAQPRTVLELVDDALREEEPEKARARQDAVRNGTWDARAEWVSELIERNAEVSTICVSRWDQEATLLSGNVDLLIPSAYADGTDSGRCAARTSRHEHLQRLIVRSTVLAKAESVTPTSANRK